MIKTSLDAVKRQTRGSGFHKFIECVLIHHYPVFYQIKNLVNPELLHGGLSWSHFTDKNNPHFYFWKTLPFIYNEYFVAFSSEADAILFKLGLD